MGDTIFAVGTGAGRAAIVIIRISGPRAPEMLQALAGRLPPPRRATYATLRDPVTREVLDRGLVIYFGAPASSTGENYAELQLHGGRAIIDATLAALINAGLRAAEPGEFTRRAFANGKLDLSQVEALADLIDAQTSFQRRQALRVAGGALRNLAEQWRGGIIEALALVESELDFSDEGDVAAVSPHRLRERLAPIIGSMQQTLGIAPGAERLRDGFTVMILGRPNAGKSTLLNALAGREMAIVSPTPGTTRDMIEAHLDIGGMPVTFIDTAGLREAEEEIERIGIERVVTRASTADLALWLSDSGEAPEGPADVEFIRVATKSDARNAPEGWLAISAAKGNGLDALLSEIKIRATSQMGDGGSALLIRARHRKAVDEACTALKQTAVDKPAELLAEDLRRAARAIGRISGEVDVEDVLDAVFSRFCIGK